MACKICGEENGVKYYPEKHNSLCKSCAKDTPNKVSRAEFDKAYFSKGDDCPEATRREFYSDYLASNSSLADYIKNTTSAC